MKILQYLIFYLLGFALLYIDGIGNDDGGLTIGQIWKVPILLYLAYKVITKIRLNFIKYRIYHALSKLFNADTMISLFGNLAYILKSMSLPLLLAYIDQYVSYKKAFRFLLIISQIIIISFIPFWLGIIEERHSYKGATLIGTQALIGPFNNAHTASIYLSTAILSLIHYIKVDEVKKTTKAYYAFLALIGIYFLLHTYVRTGYLMFIIGAFFLLFGLKRNWIKNIFFGLIGIGVMVAIGFWMMDNDQTLRQRIYERTGYNDNEEELSGSGRIYIWKTSWELWYNSENTTKYLFGHGLNALKKQEYYDNGLYVGSHNGFLDALSQNGIVGLLFFLLYYVLMIKYLYRYRENKHHKLFVAWLFSDLGFQFVQGGVFIFYDLLSAFIILMPKLDSEKDKKKHMVSYEKRYLPHSYEILYKK